MVGSVRFRGLGIFWFCGFVAFSVHPHTYFVLQCNSLHFGAMM